MKPMVTVLHVEDSDNDFDLVRLALDQGVPGWRRYMQVVRARNAEEAHQATAETVPDLVLLDLKLPGRTGHDLLEGFKARRDTRQVPVVVLSSSSDPADVAKAYERHAAAYLVKPRSFGDLVAMLASFERFWVHQVALA